MRGVHKGNLYIRRYMPTLRKEGSARHDCTVGLCWCVVARFLFIGLGWFVWSLWQTETDDDRNARLEREAVEQAERAAKKADDKRNGFHCLRGWDGSHDLR